VLLCAAEISCRTGAPAWIVKDMVEIPGGSFAMGSDGPDANENEKPVHAVTLSGFRIDRTEVTVKAYRACVVAGKCIAPEGYVQEKGNYRVFCNWDNPDNRDNHPINCVDFGQALAFCTWTGKRLPTEEEWEFAARGGGEEDRVYPWGSQSPTENLLNACGAECPAHLIASRFPGGRALYPSSDGWPETSPVGSFPAGASKHGILDMAGNVWEWTSSVYATYDGAHTESKRVLRGGSWGGFEARTERTTNRFRLDESSRAQFLGFRCAR
jgi:formylglycine-generating enzyme required for sulfatase activity